MFRYTLIKNSAVIAGFVDRQLAEAATDIICGEASVPDTITLLDGETPIIAFDEKRQRDGLAP